MSWRRFIALVAVTVTPGLLALQPVAATVSQEQEVVGQPPTLSLPEQEIAVPATAPEGEGALAVPEDWTDALPAVSRRSVEEVPEPESEVVAGRDAVTEVWANVDGTTTVKVHGEPINYLASDGQSWERIDNTVVADPDRPGWLRNAANDWTVRFGPIEPGGAGGVEVVTDKGPARFAPVMPAGSATVNPVVGAGSAANSVSYPDVWPGVTVVYTVSGDQVKEDLVVSATNRSEFPFMVEGLGLTDARAAEGTALVATGSHADEVAVLAPEVVSADGKPVGDEAGAAIDVAAPGAGSTQAGSDVATVGDAAVAVPPDGQLLTVAVDPAWLSGLAGDELPVVVDPTVVLDGSFRTAFKSDGTSLSQELRVGNSLGGGGGADSYWRSVAAFGYWSSLSGKQLLNASLSLGVADGSATSTQGVSVWWACSSDYSGSICGGDTARRYATGTIGGPGSGATLDVTELVGLWQFFGVQTGIFGFRGAETPGSFTYKRMHPPVLTLNLNTPLAAGPDLLAPADKSLAITSMTPTLTWSPVTDADGDLVTYTAKIATGMDGESGLVASSAQGTATSWVVPAGVLRDGITYYWKVYASDGNSWKPSAIRSLTVDRRLGEGGASPTDELGGVTTNLVTGNASLQLGGPSLPAVGGRAGVGFTYNSQSPMSGLAGEYRHDVDGDSATTGIEAGDPVVLARTDPQVSFDWRTEAQGGQQGSSPMPSLGVPEDHFSVRWTGFVALPAGDWQFGWRVDDGVRVWVDNTTVIDDWTNGEAQSQPEFQTGNVAGGSVRPIKIEYRESTGAATVELWVRNAADPTQAFIVPAEWLSAQPRVLPRGWTLQADQRTYVRAEVSEASVTLYRPDGSAVSFAATAFGLGYAPPPGVADVVVVNSGGTVTAQVTDGYTYVFRADGGLAEMTSALDDTNSAAITRTYDTAGHITALGDPVSGRQVTLTYAPDSTCQNQPPILGGDTYGPTPSGMLCRVDYWDGTTTHLYYKNGLLAYVRNPGDAYWGFSYDTTGRLIGFHDPVAFDTAMSGARSDWAELLTEIDYDIPGRTTGITEPPANQGEARPSHTYGYLPNYDANGELTGGSATVTVAGVTGTDLTVTYDARGRTTTETDILGLTATTSWNADDRVIATQEPDGLRSTTTYDTLGQPTDEWGPAPASMFNPDGTGQTGVPHEIMHFDEGIDGLAVQWWGNPTFDGAPVLHDHDAGSLENDWGLGSPGSAIPSDNFSGRYTGSINFPVAGTYTMRFVRDNKLLVYLDDSIRLAKWEDSVSAGDDITITTSVANTVERLRIDYADTTGPAALQMLWKPPGASAFVAVPGSSLRTGFALPTSNVGADGTTTAVSYADPALDLGADDGIAVTTTIDPSGAALTQSITTEPEGTGWRRPVSRTLPGGAGTATTTSYYGDTEARDNPCTLTEDPAIQAGMAKLYTAADPDGAGPEDPIVTETVYDGAGRTVATRNGSEDWTCTTYDARGRVAKVKYPAFGGHAARTVNYSYSVDPDGAGPRPASPLVTSVSDPNGTIVAETDLLGRKISYTDAFGNDTTFAYDLAGAMTGSMGPVGAVGYTYDTAGRLASVSRNGQVVAEVNSYDSADRLLAVTYPTGTGNAGNGTTGAFTYDAQGEIATITWSGPGGTLITSDEVSRDGAGKVTGQIVDGIDHHAGNDYVYDAAGRLVEAWVPGRHVTYEFAATGGCGTLSTAGANSNRTRQTVDGGASTEYCYDNADRITSASDGSVGTIDYDAHGNTSSVFGETHSYDAANRHIASTKGSTTVSYVRDSQDRIVERQVNGETVARYGYTGSTDFPAFVTDSANAVLEVTFSLPGGAMLTTRPGGNVWSYPSVHGDIVANADQSGLKQGATVLYDPYGNLVASGPIDNSAGNFDYGWLGRAQRLVENEPTLQPVIEMGARQYSPLLGRFLEVDPIVGGSSNDYDYSNADPVNQRDLSGLLSCSTSRTLKSWRGAGRNRNKSSVFAKVRAWCSVPMGRIEAYLTLEKNNRQVSHKGMAPWQGFGASSVSRQKTVTKSRFENEGRWSLEWSAEFTPPPGLKIQKNDSACWKAGRNLNCRGVKDITVFSDGSYWAR